MNRKYNHEHIQFIKDNIPGCSFKDLTDKFNAKFGMNLSVTAVVSLADRHGLHNGRDTRLNSGWEPTQFKKGHVPYNKSMKKFWVGGEDTQFQKGHRPHNYKPVGTERINTDGYVDIKIADPNKWKGKHKIIWEEKNGPIPNGHVLIFGDGNKLNVTLDNLILIPRSKLAIVNRYNLIQASADLTRSALIVADIKTKISKIK